MQSDSTPNTTTRQLPAGFVERINAESRVDAAALLGSLLAPPVTGVRLNKAKCVTLPPEFGDAEPVRWCRDAFYLAERPDFTLMPELHAGAFYVQDPSSAVMQTVVERLAGDRPVRMLDMCAAPGGKSTAALAALPKGSLLVSNEVMSPRAAILAENIIKWGNPDVIVTSATSAALGRLDSRFDIVATDAPCSGEGMMRKDETAVSQWSPRLVESCARLQREILGDITTALRPGGYLIYSTCTFSRSENEENVEWLMEQFGYESVDVRLEEFGIPAGWSDKAHTYRFMPHLTRGEGLFLAVLRKPGDGAVLTSRQSKKGKKSSPADIIPSWIENTDLYSPVGSAQSIHMLRREHCGLFSDLEGIKARILHAGVEIGVPKKKDLVPAHALALSTILREEAFPYVELDRQSALGYLNRTLTAMPGDFPKGFLTVGYRGQRLGFVKNLGNRINSLYPAEWRIRKSII